MQVLVFEVQIHSVEWKLIKRSRFEVKHLKSSCELFALLTCGRGIESALAVPGCLGCRRPDHSGYGTQGSIPTAPLRAASPACLIWIEAPPLPSGHLLLVPSVFHIKYVVNYQMSEFANVVMLKAWRFSKFKEDHEEEKNHIVTLMNSRTWSVVRQGVDWVLRFDLCVERSIKSTWVVIINKTTNKVTNSKQYNTVTLGVLYKKIPLPSYITFKHFVNAAPPFQTAKLILIWR